MKYIFWSVHLRFHAIHWRTAEGFQTHIDFGCIYVFELSWWDVSDPVQSSAVAERDVPDGCEGYVLILLLSL